MGRLDKLKREMITEANRRLLNETGPLNIDEGQNITLQCDNITSGRVIDIDGRIDVNSRDVSTGYRDSRGDYVDHEEVVPQFMVIRERGLDGGVLAGQDETFNINIQKIEDPELITYIGEGVKLLYCRDAYCSDKYFCKVMDVTAQFGSELRKNGVDI
jgi:hypothetical protein